MKSTKIEKRYLGKIAQLPCCLCGASGVEIHHLREGQGMSQRADNFLTIPLCPSCHRDNILGIHGQKTMLKIIKTTELQLLADTLEKIFGECSCLKT